MFNITLQLQKYRVKKTDQVTTWKHLKTSGRENQHLRIDCSTSGVLKELHPSESKLLKDSQL